MTLAGAGRVDLQACQLLPPSLSLMIAAGCVLAGATRAAGLPFCRRGVPTRQRWRLVASRPRLRSVSSFRGRGGDRGPRRRESQKDNWTIVVGNPSHAAREYFTLGLYSGQVQCERWV